MEPILPWFWRSLPLEGRTGSQIFAALFAIAEAEGPGEPSIHNIATLLESPYPTPTPNPHARYSICAGAPRIVENRPRLWIPPIGEILPFLHHLLECSKQTPQPKELPEGESLPFTGGWLGWLGYDLAWEIEKLPYFNPDPLPFPVAYWYEPAEFAILDHHQQKLWLAASDRAALEVMEKRVRAGSSGWESPEEFVGEADSEAIATPLEFQISQSQYEKAVQQAKKYIEAGDIFQANLSLRFETAIARDSWAVYRALHQINPSPFASYWQTPWGEMVSCSPERLVQLQRSQAQTRPIAGTRARGETPQRDRFLAEELLANQKERAEHIMLVDLERNDLGRVCQWGSVQVNELLTIERYSHVMHLVSNAIGTLRPECDAVDLIRAMFPGGTITGCPKVRCMEIIEELEPLRRSLFYGSCGYLDWRGQLDLNILIRTLLLAPPQKPAPANGGETLGDPGETTPETAHRLVWGQVGAGIVADSDPEREWHESLHKAQAQIAAMQLVLKQVAS